MSREYLETTVNQDCESENRSDNYYDENDHIFWDEWIGRFMTSVIQAIKFRHAFLVFITVLPLYL
jgi:hypothetical protein